MNIDKRNLLLGAAATLICAWASNVAAKRAAAQRGGNVSPSPYDMPGTTNVKATQRTRTLPRGKA